MCHVLYVCSFFIFFVFYVICLLCVDIFCVICFDIWYRICGFVNLEFVDISKDILRYIYQCNVFIYVKLYPMKYDSY